MPRPRFRHGKLYHGERIRQHEEVLEAAGNQAFSEADTRLTLRHHDAVRADFFQNIGMHLAHALCDDERHARLFCLQGGEDARLHIFGNANDHHIHIADAKRCEHTTVRDVCTRRIGNKIGNFLYRLSVFINGKHFFSCLRKCRCYRKTKLSKSNDCILFTHFFSSFSEICPVFYFPNYPIRIRCSGL